MIEGQPTTSGEAHEVVALAITSGAECNCTGGSRLHGIIMFLMGLHIAAELQLTVFIVIQIKSSHECPWAESVGHTIVRGKHIKPENTHHDHFFEHQGWEALEQDRVIHASCLLLNGPYKMLNFGDMFIVGTNIETRTCSSQGPMECLEFAVSVNHLNEKMMRTI